MTEKLSELVTRLALYEAQVSVLNDKISPIKSEIRSELATFAVGEEVFVPRDHSIGLPQDERGYVGSFTLTREQYQVTVYDRRAVARALRAWINEEGGKWKEARTEVIMNHLVAGAPASGLNSISENGILDLTLCRTVNKRETMPRITSGLGDPPENTNTEEAIFIEE